MLTWQASKSRSHGQTVGHPHSVEVIIPALRATMIMGLTNGCSDIARSTGHSGPVTPVTLAIGISIRLGSACGGSVRQDPSMWTTSDWHTCVAPDASFSEKDRYAISVHYSGLFIKSCSMHDPQTHFTHGGLHWTNGGAPGSSDQTKPYRLHPRDSGQNQSSLQ